MLRKYSISYKNRRFVLNFRRKFTLETAERKSRQTATQVYLCVLSLHGKKGRARRGISDKKNYYIYLFGYGKSSDKPKT